MNWWYIIILIIIMMVFWVGGVMYDKKLEKRRVESAKYYMELQKKRIEKLEKLEKQSEWIKKWINTKTQSDLQNLKKMINK